MSAAELSSMATALDDLTGRVAALARRYQEARREDLSAELYEVERTLSAALARLERAAALARG
jgi:hypothetical protein